MDFLHRTWAEIDTSALVHNLNTIKSLSPKSKIMAVVKANSYGHSAPDTAPVLQKNGADSFGVSNIEEALQLRECGIIKPILILGYTPVEMVKELSDNNISQCVYSREYAEMLSKSAKENNVTIKIHIKLDTGMSRLGFDCRNKNLIGCEDAIYSAKLPNFYLEGVFTHFASSDRCKDRDDGFTDAQFKRFSDSLDEFKKSGLSPEICHCCNSAGLILDDDKTLDMCRAGIILYGLYPSPEVKADLIPVMSLKSVVSMIKSISKGDTVSYGRTFTAQNDMKIATVTAGYADGYPRSLSNKGYVIVGGHKAKIVGRVCMDQFCIDVSDIPNVNIGDEVVLFGKELSVDILADICGTINYEIVCGVSPRVPRIIK